jgi:hypothetical protein
MNENMIERKTSPQGVVPKCVSKGSPERKTERLRETQAVSASLDGKALGVCRKKKALHIRQHLRN